VYRVLFITIIIRFKVRMQPLGYDRLYSECYNVGHFKPHHQEVLLCKIEIDTSI
jgi:hypothetical protein